MKKILLVDDDALVLELYRKKIAAGGYEVRTANDGLEAIKVMGEFVPDFIILDLMMPRLSGTDVLKFIRTKPALAKVPVGVWTNAFMSDQARLVNSMGVSRAIVKGDCTPARMLELVNEVLGAESINASGLADAVMPEAAPVTTTEAPAAVPDAREIFLANIPTEFGGLLALAEEFAGDPASAVRTGNLGELCRRVHHLSGAAGSAGFADLALLSSALEALLFELGEKPQFLNPSTTRTVTMAAEFLGILIQMARTRPRLDAVLGTVLAVDDDPLANQIVLAALRRARIAAQAVENPGAALELLSRQSFDLVLLDIELPGMNGLELCRKIREQPGYLHTPVIYITSHADFEHRAKAAGVAGDDLIIKPIFPIELTVKAVMHLIRVKLTTPAAPSSR